MVRKRVEFVEQLLGSLGHEIRFAFTVLGVKVVGRTLKLTFLIVVPPKIGHRATQAVWNQLQNAAPSERNW
jgi:hypothetical protein